MSDSKIVVGAGGTAYVGPDAVNLVRARTLRASIRMHKNTGMLPTRGVTITRMFAFCGQYTGKKYKRGQHDAAIADMDKWIAAMTAATPVENNQGEPL